MPWAIYIETLDRTLHRVMCRGQQTAAHAATTKRESIMIYQRLFRDVEEGLKRARRCHAKRKKLNALILVTIGPEAEQFLEKAANMHKVSIDRMVDVVCELGVEMLAMSHPYKELVDAPSAKRAAKKRPAKEEA